MEAISDEVREEAVQLVAAYCRDLFYSRIRGPFRKDVRQRYRTKMVRNMAPGPMRDELARNIRYRAAHVGSRCAELKRAKASSNDERLRKAINDVTILCDSEARLKRLIFATHDVKPEIFWPAWFGWWPAVDFSAEFHDILPDLFYSKGLALPYFNEAQRARYDVLPDEITVYRGCDVSFTEGVSWTTDRKVAEYFAGGGRYGRPDWPVIVTGTIDKRCFNFFFCCDDRNEAEIICRPVEISVDDA